MQGAEGLRCEPPGPDDGSTGCVRDVWAWGSAQCHVHDPLPRRYTRRRAGPFSSSRCGASVPIPVPTQVHNYQRIEQNLQSPTQYQTPR